MVPATDIPSEDVVDTGILSVDIVVVDDIDQHEHGEAYDDGLLRLRGGVSSKGSFYPTSRTGSIGTRRPSSRPRSSTGLILNSGLCPTNDYIRCVNGFNHGITCASACNGQCCTGSEACTGSTGKIDLAALAFEHVSRLLCNWS